MQRSLGSVRLFRVHDHVKMSDNEVNFGGKLGCAISETVDHMAIPFGSLVLLRNQCSLSTSRPRKNLWALNSSATPDQALLFEGIRGPYVFDSIAKHGALLLLFFRYWVGHRPDGQISIVIASQQRNPWSAETILQTSESTARILLN